MKTRIHGQVAAIAFLLYLITFAGPIERASAQSLPWVVVVAAQCDLPFAERVAAELDTMGYAATAALSPSSAEPRSVVEAIVRDRNLAAGVHLALSTGAVRLQFYRHPPAPSTGALVRRLPRQTGENGGTLAIRAAELVRATLAIPELDADVAPPEPAATRTSLPRAPGASSAPLPGPLFVETRPQEAPVSSADAVEPARPPAIPRAIDEPSPEPGPGLLPAKAPSETVEPKPLAGAEPAAITNASIGPLTGIEMSTGVIGSPQGLPPFPALALGAGWYVLRWVRLGAFGMLPLRSAHHHAGQGSSDTSVTMAGVEVRLEQSVLGSSRWQMTAGVGAALASLTSTGQGTPPLFVNRQDSALGGGPVASAGIGFVALPALVLRVQTNLGWATAPFSIRYAGDEVAKWGTPWWAVWAGAELKVRLGEP